VYIAQYYIVICALSGLPYFSTLYTKDAILVLKVIEHKLCFCFFYTFRPKYF